MENNSYIVEEVTGGKLFRIDFQTDGEVIGKFLKFLERCNISAENIGKVSSIHFGGYFKVEDREKIESWLYLNEIQPPKTCAQNPAPAGDSPKR